MLLITPELLNLHLKLLLSLYLLATQIVQVIEGLGSHRVDIHNAMAVKDFISKVSVRVINSLHFSSRNFLIEEVLKGVCLQKHHGHKTFEFCWSDLTNKQVWWSSKEVRWSSKAV